MMSVTEVVFVVAAPLILLVLARLVLQKASTRPAM